MAGQNMSRLPDRPPAPVMAAMQKRLPSRSFQALQAVLALRGTAQAMDNTLTVWLADTAGSVARFQILTLLWASPTATSHKEIVLALGVTRATVSGLMAGLERDGVVQSHSDQNDRRILLAGLTQKGTAVAEEAVSKNAKRLRSAFARLSVEDLLAMMSFLEQIKQSFGKLP